MSHVDSPAHASLGERVRGVLTRPTGSHTTGRAGWLRAVGHGLVLAGLLFLAYVFLVIAPREGIFGMDAWAYWNVDMPDVYGVPLSGFGSFPYSPPAALVADTFDAVPWTTFIWFWTALLVATGIFIGGSGIWIAVVFAFPPVALDLLYGNIHLLLAVAVALGFRYPWTWTFVLLTKFTMGVGLLWFVVRREWRELAIAVVPAAVICAVSYVIVPAALGRLDRVPTRLAPGRRRGRLAPDPALAAPRRRRRSSSSGARARTAAGRSSWPPRSRCRSSGSQGSRPWSASSPSSGAARSRAAPRPRAPSLPRRQARSEGEGRHGCFGGRAIAAVLSVFAVVAIAGSVVAQPPEEEFDRPFLDEPVTGYERSDDIVVLDDRSFCSHLLGIDLGRTRADVPRPHQPHAPAEAGQARGVRAGLRRGDARCVRQRAQRVPRGAVDRRRGRRLGPRARRHPGGLRGAPAGGRRDRPARHAASPGRWRAHRGLREPRPARRSRCSTATTTSSPTRAPAARGPPRSAASMTPPSSRPCPSPRTSTTSSSANYFWDVTADDCDWSVDITAVAPIPDPTPTPRPMATVPQLAGPGPWVAQQENPEYLTVEQAREALDAAGLRVGACEHVSLRVEAPRRVVGQDPAPGTQVPPGSEVNVVVREEGCDVLTAP